ncbi:copper amine oxidase N-terminal domain-containing protein [Paenibacillus beijingensis]|uniref:Copper amine oxidase n=1 Tax=Paenibacillus beijingensis TaxID=1126833 RepID=A0A0D5NIE1_9BACL|nr:copper amine oxidase N-terminal domain-containing protein [Paenibacillus beijingensis]AJY75129.1 copper amine oxidase [Paenibacillus beijingensis]
MRKSWMVFVSCVLATSLMAGSAFAKSEGSAGNGQNADAQSKQENGKVNVQIKVKAEKEKTATSVTYDTYGHDGYKGLLVAIENVKDKPAGAVIADLLLTKYNAQLTAQQKAELEAIKEKDAALTVVADLLDRKGSVTEAVYIQKAAIKANVRNLDSYKKLGKLYNKIGKKGVKLYVNGEEPKVTVAPFIKNGSTLVPFRAISESLKANVSYNAKQKLVIVSRGGITVKLYINSKIAFVGGTQVKLDVPATIVNGSTVVPVRFVSESLKAVVKWEQESKSVVIYEK